MANERVVIVQEAVFTVRQERGCCVTVTAMSPDVHRTAINCLYEGFYRILFIIRVRDFTEKQW